MRSGFYAGRRSVCLGLLLCAASVHAQRADPRDSLATALLSDSTHIYRVTIAKPYLRLENRTSFLNHARVNFLGFMAGVNLHQNHIVCAGYYQLDRRSKIPFRQAGTGRLHEYGNVEFVNVSYQYIFLNRKHLQMQLPLEFGYGSYRVGIDNDLPTNAGIPEEGNFIPISGGLQSIIRPVRSAGISLMLGYRYAKHEALALEFNGFYYAFGIWIDARQVYRDLRYAWVKKRYREALEQLE
jgi:hypothetical protein